MNLLVEYSARIVAAVRVHVEEIDRDYHWRCYHLGR